MSATSNRRSAGEIVEALGAVLLALQWTPAGGSAESAFQSVKLFDLDALAAALSELIVSQERVCFIVPGDERFTARAESPARLVMTRTLPVALLLSDRVLGDRQAALYGTDTNPGAFSLLELALPAVTGVLLANPRGVLVKPVTAAVVTVKDEARTLPGRACVELDLDCTGGTLSASLGAGPIL